MLWVLVFHHKFDFTNLPSLVAWFLHVVSSVALVHKRISQVGIDVVSNLYPTVLCCHVSCFDYLFLLFFFLVCVYLFVTPLHNCFSSHAMRKKEKGNVYESYVYIKIGCLYLYIYNYRKKKKEINTLWVKHAFKKLCYSEKKFFFIIIV